MQLRRVINVGLRQSLNISGQTSRRDYWPYVLLLGSFVSAIVMILNELTTYTPRLAVNNQVQGGSILPSEAFGFAYAAVIFGTVSFFAISTRRLRDAALSPWLSLVALVVVFAPALLFFIATNLPSGEGTVSAYLSLYWTIFISPAAIILLLLLCLLPTKHTPSTSLNGVRQ